MAEAALLHRFESSGEIAGESSVRSQEARQRTDVVALLASHDEGGSTTLGVVRFVGRGAEDVVIETWDAQPRIQPSRLDCACAGIVGKLVEVSEQLLGCEEGSIAVSAGYAAAAHHAVEHCLDIGRDSIRT